MRRILKTALQWPGAFVARAKARTARAPRFAGVYPSRDAALCALPADQKKGYDTPEIADVSFDWMCQRAAWDYPLIYWLDRLLPQGGAVLDAGGHLGTKYIAFTDVLDMRKFAWTIYDLPGIVHVARARQTAGALPAEISFIDTLLKAPACDILMASDLVQYLDEPFARFLDALTQRPRHILLNKVPVHAGAGHFTVERIGCARVPYQIRNETAWQSEIAGAGYDITDTWEIAGLSHQIATHPWRGPCESRGYLLTKTE